MASEKRIAWLDVESTGIDASSCNLLEVACIVTDMELNILDEEGYRAVIKYSPEEVVEMQAKTDPYVLDMHSNTGLWDELPNGKPKETVDEELLAYIQKFAPEYRQAFLGGNSITLDRNFIIPNLKKVGEHLHYQSIDVTTIAILAEAWYGLSFEKSYLHAALSDIKESVNQLKYFKSLLPVSK